MNERECFRLPAEWEPQSGVQLTWPHEGTDWRPRLAEIERFYVELAVAIALRERLLVVAPEPERALRAIALRAPEVVMGRISAVECPTDDTWARDHGFITLVGSAGGRRLLDFGFNGWGGKYRSSLDNAINGRVFASGALRGEYADCLDFVLEGGSIESDGRGTIFTTSACLLAPGRNQPLSRAEIEARLKESLSAERIVWVDHGRLAGDDTDGHIDTLARLAPGDTILYVSPGEPTDGEQYSGLRAMEAQLRSLRTAEGKPYRLLPLPKPRPVVSGGERLPATYANFLAINGAVVMPSYGQPDLDAEAARTVAMAFPGREVVAIDCREVIAQHGSLHCCTMQFPEGVMEF